MKATKKTADSATAKRRQQYAAMLETLEADHAQQEVRLSDLGEEVDALSNARVGLQELVDLLDSQ